MATNKNESPIEKVAEFFTQNPEDRSYEEAGGDDRVPQADRKGDPRAEARAFAAVNGEDDPYPEDGAVTEAAVGDEPAES